MRHWAVGFGLVLLCLVLLPATNAEADTSVSGAITEDTTWTTAGSPYLVTADLTVYSPWTLTIEPGVVVKFQTSTCTLIVNGTLNAAGTPEQPIAFTGMTQSAGSWDGIRVSSTGTLYMDYCNLSYGGYAGSGGISAMIKVEGGTATIDHSTLMYSATKCAWQASGTLALQNSSLSYAHNAVVQSSQGPFTMSGCTLTSTDSVSKDLWVLSATTVTLTGNAFYGRQVDIYPTADVTLSSNTFDIPLWIHPYQTRLSVTSNYNTAGASGYLGFEVNQASFAITGTSNTLPGGIRLKGALGWGEDPNGLSVPTDLGVGVPGYRIMSDGLSIIAAKTVNVAAGTAFTFEGITSRLTVNGTLNATGTAERPVTFTGVTQSEGSWDGILVPSGGVLDMDYCTVTYGGNSTSGKLWALVKLDGGSATIDNSTLRFSATKCAWQASGTLAFQNSTLSYAHNAVVQSSQGPFAMSGCTLDSVYTGSLDLFILSLASPMTLTGCIFNGKPSEVYPTAGADVTLTGNTFNAPFWIVPYQMTLAVTLSNNEAGANGYLGFRVAQASITLAGTGNALLGDIRLKGTLGWDAQTQLSSPASVGAQGYRIPADGLSIITAKTISVAPGTAFFFEATTSRLTVNGTLNAVGTPQEEITFTGVTQTAGSWDGILVPAGGALDLDYCTVSYGGSSGGQAAMLKVNGGTAMVDHCTFSHSARSSLVVYSGSATVSLSSFTYSSLYGVQLAGGGLTLNDSQLWSNYIGLDVNTLAAMPTVRGNSFVGNTSWALRNERADSVVDATGNWWGDPSGPPLANPNSVYLRGETVLWDPPLSYDPTLAGPDVTLFATLDPFNIKVTLAATAESPFGVDRVVFYWDHDGVSTELGVDYTTPYSCDWVPGVQLEQILENVPNAFGNRVLRAQAYDPSGRSGSNSLEVTQDPAFRLPLDPNAQGTRKYIYRYFDLDPVAGTKADWLGGQLTYDGHTGTDYDWPYDSEVFAARGGEVVELRNTEPDEYNPEGGLGNYAMILHAGLDDGQGYYTCYGHMQQGSIPPALVQAYQAHRDDPNEPPAIVETGNLLGLQGESGNAEGPHVHFRVEVVGGSTVCPYHLGLVQGPLFTYPQP